MGKAILLFIFQQPPDKKTLKKPYFLGVLDNLHMKTTISSYKSRFSLMRNVFFNNLIIIPPKSDIIMKIAAGTTAKPASNRR